MKTPICNKEKSSVGRREGRRGAAKDLTLGKRFRLRNKKVGIVRKKHRSEMLNSRSELNRTCKNEMRVRRRREIGKNCGVHMREVNGDVYKDVEHRNRALINGNETAMTVMNKKLTT